MVTETGNGWPDVQVLLGVTEGASSANQEGAGDALVKVQEGFSDRDSWGC